MASSKKIRRVAVQRLVKSGELAAVFHIRGHAGYQVLDLSPDMKSITRVRNPRNLFSDPFEKTGYVAEIAEEKIRRDGGSNIFEHRLIRVLSPEDRDLDRWTGAESLEGLPVSAEPEITEEELAWAGGRKGKLTVGIIAAVVAVGSTAAAIGGYLMGAGHWGVAVVAVASAYVAVRYPWKMPRKPSPEKLAELKAYKEELRRQAGGELPEASQESEEAEVPQEAEASQEPEEPEEVEASQEAEASQEPEEPEEVEASQEAEASEEPQEVQESEEPQEAEEPKASEEPQAELALGEDADEDAEESAEEPAAWDGLSPERFETSVSTRLETEGFKIQATRFLKDGGIDVEALDDQWSPVVVQVKRHQKNVGVSVVREMIGVREQRPDNPRVIIYSPVGFTRGAKGLAKTSGVELREFDTVDAGTGRTDDDSHLDGRILDA